MTDRYAPLFRRLESSDEAAFVPFLVLGDPSIEESLSAIRVLIAAGADALELGIPFSDPVADGPVVQGAQRRALAAGVTPAACWEAIAALRAEHPALPIGLLVYANLVVRPGLAPFYRAAAGAGVDSVLVADAPLAEAAPFERAASDHGVAPVLVAPPNADDARLAAIAARSRGYTYLAARRGVTGDDRREAERLAERVARLRALGAPPPVVGFGIGRPDQVRAALAAGAAGVIAGSALVRRLADGRPDGLDRAVELAASLKAATRRIVAPG